MDWLGTALLMGLAAALSASATLAFVRRREIAGRFAGRKRAPGAMPPGKATPPGSPAVAKRRPARPAAQAKPAPATPRRAEDTGLRLPPAPAAAAREAEQWERRFKLMHAMVPEARRQDIICRTMAKHGLDRAQAIRRIVEDRKGEDALRS